jgi:hypothetical protein
MRWARTIHAPSVLHPSRKIKGSNFITFSKLFKRLNTSISYQNVQSLAIKCATKQLRLFL